jgi:hypothetical protein
MALGFGFRCGFLGLLHMEIVQERLEREFDMDLVTTAPGVLYRVTTTDGVVQEIDSPAKLPDAGRIQTIEEPVITAMVLTPAEHVGGILQLCQDKRGVQKTLEYLASDRVLITYELPFNEVVLDFYDKLKTISRGYASLDYHVTGYWPSPLVKLDILVNGDPVDALSIIVHRDMAYERGPRPGVENARADSAADVRGRDSSGDRRAHHRARIGEGDAQERAGEVLRRRHHAQAQAARETERGQEAHEAGRQSADPAGSVSRRAEDGDGARVEGLMAEPFKKSTLREYFESIVIAVILALFIRTFVVQAFKIPTGSMEENLLIGDHLLVNKFVFGPSATALGACGCCPMGSLKARRGRRLQVSRGARPRFHQARDRPAGRNRGAAGKEGLHQRYAAERALRSLSGAAPHRRHRVQRGDVVRRPRALRSGDGPAQSVFRHGRQPRQLAGQPLLGASSPAIWSREKRW